MFLDLLSESGLSLDRLQSFCLVAEAGGVTKAAKGDSTKQSLFSRQIKELEEFFGAELIRRKGRGIALTDTGARLNAIARDSFTALSDFKSHCKGRPFEIVIGTGEAIIHWLFMPRLEALRKQLPRARLKFLNIPTGDAVKRLADGIIDFAVVRKDAVRRPLVCEPLGSLTYSIFVPRTLTAASAKSIIKGLDRLPIATLEGDGSFRTQLAALARKEGLSLNIEVECSSFPLAARAAARGNVAAILPSIAAKELADADVNEIVAPFLKQFEREMCLAWNPRLARIRPRLQQVATVLARAGRF